MVNNADRCKYCKWNENELDNVLTQQQHHHTAFSDVHVARRGSCYPASLTTATRLLDLSKRQLSAVETFVGLRAAFSFTWPNSHRAYVKPSPTNFSALFFFSDFLPFFLQHPRQRGGGGARSLNLSPNMLVRAERRNLVCRTPQNSRPSLFFVPPWSAPGPSRLSPGYSSGLLPGGFSYKSANAVKRTVCRVRTTDWRCEKKRGSKVFWPQKGERGRGDRGNPKFLSTPNTHMENRDPRSRFSTLLINVSCANYKGALAAGPYLCPLSPPPLFWKG